MSLPPLELLESTHSFPCRYVFKVIGHNSQEFVDANRSVAVSIVGDHDHVQLTYRVSAQGNHGSVTLDVFVTGADQILAIYTALKDVPGLRMLL